MSHNGRLRDITQEDGVMDDNPWEWLCVCGHAMREHVLDLELDPEVDCRHDGCSCPGFALRARRRPASPQRSTP